MRLDVVVNATAKHFRARPYYLERIRALAAGAARVAVTSSFAELDAACRAIAARGSELVVLCGGDGSHMAGVTALADAFGEERLPNVALAPGGTACTVSRNWGQRGHVLDYVQHVLDAVRTRRASFAPRPTLRVAQPDGTRRIGFIFGTGLVARFFDAYYEGGAAGYAGAAKLVARIFVESFYGGPFARRVLEPMPLALATDGVSHPASAFSLVVSSVVKDLGLGMRVTYRAGEDPRRLHLVASALAATKLGPRAPRVVAGRPIGGDGAFDGLVERFAVRFPGPDGGPYVLDGDLLRAREVVVTPGPTLRVLR